MKKVLLFLFLFPLICSCSKEDDNDEGNSKKTFEKSDVLGDWYFYESLSRNGIPYLSTGNNDKYRLIFENNGNATVRNDIYDKDILVGSWIFDGKNMITCEVKYENKLLEQEVKILRYRLIEVAANEITVEPLYDDQESKDHYDKYIKDPNAPRNILGIAHEESSTYFDALGVVTWRREEKIEFTDAYTLLDTVFSNRRIEPSVYYMFNEGDSITVDWVTNGEIVKTVTENKRWIQEEQKWAAVSKATIKVTVDKNFTYGADIVYPARTVKRFKTIPEIITKKDESDIFGFTFGMHKSEINLNHEYAPTLALASNQYADYLYYLEFKDAKLIRIYCTTRGFDYNRLEGMAKRLKSPEPLKAGYDKIENPQEWDNGKLKFKAAEVDFSAYPYIGGFIPCISIEKL